MKHSIQMIVVLTVLVVLVSSTAFGAYGGGSGTQADPYQIWTPQQMFAVGINSADWGSCFKLMADIDMSIYPGTQYQIIGNPTTYFTGSFDGNHHAIRNLTYTTTGAVNYVGLFGATYGATIQNLGVEKISISSGGCMVGGLVGYNYSYDDYDSISQCYVTGSVSGGSYVGGLVGYNQGNVTGGGSMLTACYATCSVSGKVDVGGLVGFNNFGSISTCYSTGRVSGGSYSSSVGGLVGSNNNGSISTCYSTGRVSSGSNSSSVGGLAGSSSGISVSFWDIQTSGQTTSAGGAGMKTSEMKTLATFTSVGWDFSITDGDPADWVMPAVASYPLLSWQQSQPEQQPTLTVVANPTTGGVVTGDGTFAVGSQRTITATANTGWTFTGWNDGNTSASRTVTVPANGVTYTANFQQQQQNDTFSIASMSVKAGKRTPNSPADSFLIVGTSFDINASAVPTQADTIDFAFFNEGETEPCFEGTLPFVPQQFKKGKYVGKDAHYTFSFDVNANKHTFSLTGKKVYLCGLGSPLRLEITIGEVLLSGMALDNEASGSGGEVDVINGKNRMPLELMMGDSDALRVDKATVKAGKGGVDSLTASGVMTVADPSMNLTQQAVTIQWGAVEVVIPAGSFVRVGTKNAYIYTRPKGSTTLPDATIMMDWETGRFTMALKAPGLISQPRILNVRFLDYNESDAVN